MVNVYDFDGTIYDGDSTLDFLIFLLKKKPLLFIFFIKECFDAVLWKFGIISTVKFKENCFSCFRFFDDIEEKVLQFWNANKSKIKSFYLQKDHKNDLIISASPLFLLTPICNELEVKDLIATIVDPKTGKFISENNKGEIKVKNLYDKYPKCTINEAYSDSLSDKPLLDLAKKSYIVKKNKIIEYNGVINK